MRQYTKPRRPFKDVTGGRFGMLTVIRPLGTFRNNTYFLAKCDCGRDAEVMRQNLTSGRQKSCGCLHPQERHGHAREPEYKIWHGILERCLNQKAAGYHNYGGRGIVVCQAWRHSYEQFVADVGKRPTPEHSIDRIDNDGNYEPENCRWATTKEQAANRRLPKRRDAIEHHGRKQSVSQWAQEYGLKVETLAMRLKRGWSFEKALTTQLRR